MTKLLPFQKMHGLGNDFILADARALDVPDTEWARAARAWCDRHFGVGADGLILVQESSVAPLRMRIFNADGSEAEMCGNGIRCFARFVAGEGIVPGNGPLRVETGAGILVVETVRSGDDIAYRVNMGAPRFEPNEIPAMPEQLERGVGDLWIAPLRVHGERLPARLVSMGNPHAIAFIEESVETWPLEDRGPVVEHDAVFPNRTNFEIVNRLTDGTLAMRVWERGSGITLACGTGACAVGVADMLERGGTARTVHLPGGDLHIEWEGPGSPVFMTGPAEVVFTGELSR